MEQPLAANPIALDEQQLLAALRRGEGAALEAIVRRYQDRLYAAVLRIVHRPDDAADLVQETFLKLLQHAATFEGHSSLYTWLFRVAVNLALSQLRRKKPVSWESGDRSHWDGPATGAEGLADRHALTDPAELAALRLDHAALLQALATLDPEQRAIVVLRDIEECEYDQIAAILQLPLGTVKSRLFRARQALREAMERKPG